MSSFHRRQHAHNAGFLVAGNRTDNGVAAFAATAKMGLTTAPATTFIYPWCRSGHGLLGGFVLVPPWSGLCTCPDQCSRWKPVACRCPRASQGRGSAPSGWCDDIIVITDCDVVVVSIFRVLTTVLSIDVLSIGILMCLLSLGVRGLYAETPKFRSR